MDTNILLESGTNELEVLEFTLGSNHYGINVAKIREICNLSAGYACPKFIQVSKESSCRVIR